MRGAVGLGGRARRSALVLAPLFAAASLLTLALAAVALAAPAHGAGQEVADSVRLRFAWPVGAEGRVRFAQVIEREGDGGEATHIEVDGEYALRVREHPEGVLIEHLDPVTTRFQASPVLASDDARRVLYETLGAVLPHYVVAPDGELVAVEGIDAMREAVAGALPSGAPAEQARAVLGTLLSGPQLLGAARERWEALVGLWTDLSLRVGEPRAMATEETNPIVPSVVLPYLYELRLTGVEPCPPPGGRCARLEMISAPEPGELNRVMNEALADMGLPSLGFEGLVQESRASLLVDAATLLPHEVTLSKLVEGSLTENGRGRPFRRLDLSRMVYSWERPPPG